MEERKRVWVGAEDVVVITVRDTELRSTILSSNLIRYHTICLPTMLKMRSSYKSFPHTSSSSTRSCEYNRGWQRRQP